MNHAAQLWFIKQMSSHESCGPVGDYQADEQPLTLGPAGDYQAAEQA